MDQRIIAYVDKYLANALSSPSLASDAIRKCVREALVAASPIDPPTLATIHLGEDGNVLRVEHSGLPCRVVFMNACLPATHPDHIDYEHDF